MAPGAARLMGSRDRPGREGGWDRHQELVGSGFGQEKSGKIAKQRRWSPGRGFLQSKVVAVQLRQTCPRGIVGGGGSLTWQGQKWAGVLF